MGEGSHLFTTSEVGEYRNSRFRVVLRFGFFKLSLSKLSYFNCFCLTFPSLAAIEREGGVTGEGGG